jgi:hypothetical protein
LAGHAVAIIGHGESPKGCGWGAKIDEHVVIRLKCPDWQDAKDYGKRVDYMVSSTETLPVMLDYKRVPLEYWGQPKKGTWSSITEARFRERAKAPLKIPIEIHNRWNPVFRSLSDKTEQECPNHSLGMAAITYACELLRAEVVLLVGFDNLLDPARLDYHKAMKGAWPTRHDWTAENRMLPLIEKAFGVEIRRFT